MGMQNLLQVCDMAILAGQNEVSTVVLRIISLWQVTAPSVSSSSTSTCSTIVMATTARCMGYVIASNKKQVISCSGYLG